MCRRVNKTMPNLRIDTDLTLERMLEPPC